MSYKQTMYTLALVGMCTAATIACSPKGSVSSPSATVSGSQVISNDDLTITNNSQDLSKRLHRKNEAVAIDPAGFATQADLPVSDDVRLTLVAEIDPPVVGGQKVQATSLSLTENFVLVSYNTQGEKYKGAIDVIDIRDKKAPQITSQCLFHQADVNSISIQDGQVFMAQGGNEKDLAPRTAYFRNISMNNQGQLDVPTNTKKVGFPGFVSTHVFPGLENIYVTSGDNAGLTVLDKNNFTPKKYLELHDARWVDAEDGQVAVVQGTPGKLTLLDEETLNVTGTYNIPGLSIPESKSTVELEGGKAFVAAGPEGVQVISTETGDILGNLPRPTGILDDSKTVTNAISVDHDIAFISNGEAGIYVAKGDQAFSNSEPDENVELKVLGKLRLGTSVSANHIVYRKDCLIVASGLGGVKILTVEYPEPEPEPTPPPDLSCKNMYAMNDSGSSNSQLIKFDMTQGTFSPVGNIHQRHDLESLEISPTTGKMYAVAGGGGNQDGKFYEVDKNSGALTYIGNTGASGSKEIVSLAFHPEGELWAFREKEGLYTIDLTSGNKTKQWDVTNNVSNNWEGLAWHPDGKTLYGASNNKLYSWDSQTKQAQKVCSNLPSGVESLDFRPDGILVGARENRGKLTLFTVEVPSCEVDDKNYQVPYIDFEGLTCDTGTDPLPEPTPEPSPEPTPEPSNAPKNCPAGPVNYANLPHGTVLGEQYADQGIHFRAFSTNLPHNKLVVFDTHMNNTADPDLELNQGKISVIAENMVDKNKDGLIDSPDDSAKGGIQWLSFDQPMTVKSFKFLDKEGKTGRAVAYDSKWNKIKEVAIPVKGNKSVQTIQVNASGVRHFKLYYEESGGATDFDIQCD